MHFIPNISQNALIYPKVFKMETNNTKQAYHINYAFFVCVEKNLLCDSTEFIWITIKYISLAVILNQIPLQHALLRDQFNSDPHSWTEFWISLNWCLHLINFHIPYFLSPLAHVLFINVKFWWKYNRTLNCHICTFALLTQQWITLHVQRGMVKNRQKLGVHFWQEGCISKR